MRNILLLFTALLLVTRCLAQDTLEIKNKLSDHISEKYHLIKGNGDVKEGMYQAYYKRNTAIASGKYAHGKKTGTWFFFSPKGQLLETYNYTLNKLQFEAPEMATSDIRYLVDQQLSDTDRTTKPVKIGGRYFGYLPYLGMFQTPFQPYEVDPDYFFGVVELLISPLGRLADYKVHLVSAYYNYDRTTVMDRNLFKEEDRQFIPATINHVPVTSRIIIKCRLTTIGGLDFY